MKDYDPVIPVYEQRIETFTKVLKKINKNRSTIAWGRAIIILTIILATVYGWNNQPVVVLTTEIVIGLSIFLFLVTKDSNAKTAAENIQRLIQINKEEIAIQHGDYTDRDKGNSLHAPQHSYAVDLDIFGENSVYQYINRCTSQQGNLLLASRLLNPLPKKEILLQQQAAKEVAGAIDWRQQFQSAGLVSSLTHNTQQRLENWINQSPLYAQPVWKWIRISFPVVSISTVLLYFTDVVSSSVFLCSSIYLFPFCLFIK